MSTPRQIAANRRNAEKSTGPKMTEGKARSSGNACEPRLGARLPVLPGEDAAAYRRRLRTWAASLGPRDEVQLYLVQRAVQVSWQLDRADRVQVARLAEDMRRANDPSSAGATDRADRLRFDDSESGERLRRHQLACGQMLVRTLDAFTKLRRDTEARREDAGPAARETPTRAEGPVIDPRRNDEATPAAVAAVPTKDEANDARGPIEKTLTRLLTQPPSVESTSIAVEPSGPISPVSSPSDPARVPDPVVDRRDARNGPVTGVDRRDARSEARSSRAARGADRDARKPEWPGPRALDARRPSAPHAMAAPPCRPSQQTEASPNPTGARRRVGGYEVPLDPWVSVSGADKAPVRLRRHGARCGHAPASACPTS